MRFPYKAPDGADSSFQTEIAEAQKLVENLPPEAFSSFASLFDAMGRPEPVCQPKKAGEWAGPGFYRIEDDWGEDSAIEWVEDPEYLEEQAEYGRDFFQFLCEEVPQAYLGFAQKHWEGPGCYIAVTVREKYWEDDPTWMTQAQTPELLAEGLFRNLDLYSVQEMQLAQDGEDTDFWFECPEEPHGKIWL